MTVILERDGPDFARTRRLGVVWFERAVRREIARRSGQAGAYFLRAVRAAAAAGAGLALLHSHPGGRGWQMMSATDKRAEAGHAAQTLTLTGHPLIGLTCAGRDGAYSARLWERVGPRAYEPRWCESVRVVGERLITTWNDHLRPAPIPPVTQARTVSAWGDEVHADLVRLRVLVVGGGSVGSSSPQAWLSTAAQISPCWTSTSSRRSTGIG
jgi:hypothetical protein